MTSQPGRCRPYGGGGRDGSASPVPPCPGRCEPGAGGGSTAIRRDPPELSKGSQHRPRPRTTTCPPLRRCSGTGTRGAGGCGRCAHCSTQPCAGAPSPAITPEMPFPAGLMSPCGCGASRFEPLLSVSRVGFVRCINSSGLGSILNPRASRSEKSSLPDPISQHRGVEAKQEPGWKSGAGCGCVPPGVATCLRSGSTAFFRF